MRRRGEVQFPFQLPMFVQAGELDSGYVHNDVVAGNHDPEKIRTMKLEEARLPGSSVSGHAWSSDHHKARKEGHPSLRDSIAAEGIKSPVNLALQRGRDAPAERQVFGGHHRVYTASDMDPGMEVPVDWMDLRGPASTQPDAALAQAYRPQIERQPGQQEATEAARSQISRNDALPPRRVLTPSANSAVDRLRDLLMDRRG